MDNSKIDIQNIIDRLVRLENAVFGSENKVSEENKNQNKSIDFGINERADAERFCKMAGWPEKFTFLVAFLTQGNEETEVSYANIKLLWERMTGILGKYNPVYSDHAKRAGWVDHGKKGFYKLNSSWKGIIK